MNNDYEFYIKDSFIESPIYDNWFKKHYPQKSLLICTPYIKRDAIDKIIRLYKLDTRDSDFELKVLIRGNQEEFTSQKSSDISALDSLIAIPGLNLSNIRKISNLHMKAYLIDGKHLLITSGNMTNNGMFVISSKENFEGGISTNDPSVIIHQFLPYFSGIWKQSQSISDFYDDILAAYKKYIETEYTDKKTFQRIDLQRYHFRIRTFLDDKLPQSTIDHATNENSIENSIAEESAIYSSKNELSRLLEYSGEEIPQQHQTFFLSDLPPVGRPEHLPETLRIINKYPKGISYIELGKKLRTIFGDSAIDNDVANRKFGEEKGKFASYLGFATIENYGRNKIFKINDLGRTFLRMTDVNRNKMIKDIFFDKPIIVSILRHSLEFEDFNILQFLVDNCEEATYETLSRKEGAIKALFRLIKEICTEEELYEALNKLSK